MLPIAMHLLQKDGQFLNGHDLFLKRVGAAYHAFIDETEKGCRWGLARVEAREGLGALGRWVQRAGGWPGALRHRDVGAHCALLPGL